MGHPARHRKSHKNIMGSASKPHAGSLRKDLTVGARNGNERDVSCQPSGSDPVPQQDSATPRRPHEPLAGFDLSDTEWDSLFCMAVKHHFEQETVWVPSVLRTMALLEGINDKTGRPCRIYVRPGKRIIMVETLS